MAYDSIPQTEAYFYPAQDWGAGSDIDLQIKGPSGMKGRLRSVKLRCTETFAGAANTALHVGTAAGGTELVALAIDAAGGDAFTAADQWEVYWNDAGTASVGTSVGAPGNAVTSTTTTALAADTVHYVSLQGGTGTLTAGIADVTVVIEWRHF